MRQQLVPTIQLLRQVWVQSTGKWLRRKGCREKQKTMTPKRRPKKSEFELNDAMSALQVVYRGEITLNQLLTARATNAFVSPTEARHHPL